MEIRLHTRGSHDNEVKHSPMSKEIQNISTLEEVQKMKVNIENIKNTLKKQMEIIKGSTDNFFKTG